MILKVSKMDIVGCNASRVGGYGKIPDPFMLIGRHGFVINRANN